MDSSLAQDALQLYEISKSLHHPKAYKVGHDSFVCWWVPLGDVKVVNIQELSGYNFGTATEKIGVGVSQNGQVSIFVDGNREASLPLERQVIFDSIVRLARGESVVQEESESGGGMMGEEEVMDGEGSSDIESDEPSEGESNELSEDESEDDSEDDSEYDSEDGGERVVVENNEESLPVFSAGVLEKADLVTLKNLLSKSHSVNAGSFAGLNNTLSLKLEDGSEFRAWYNTNYKALNLQEKNHFEQSLQTQKIGLGLGADGSILSIRLDNQCLPDGESLPHDREQIILKYLRQALMSSSRFATNSDCCHVSLVLRGLRVIPEYYLGMFARAMTLHAQSTNVLTLRVEFLHDDLVAHQGIDAGGLRREFFNEMFTGLTKMPKGEGSIHFKVPEDGKALPLMVFENSVENDFAAMSLSSVPSSSSSPPNFIEKQKTLLRALGVAFMYCYKSDATIGRHFEDKFFSSVLTFTAEDLQAEVPSFEALIKASEALLGQDESNDTMQRTLQLLSQNPNTLSKGDFEGLCSLARYEEDFFEAGYVTEGDTLNLDEIKSNWDDARMLIFKSDPFLLYQKAHACFYVAQGMRSIAHRTQKDQKWGELRNTDPCETSCKIQGQFNREQIATAIVPTANCNAMIQRKAGWLRKWVRETATLQDLRNFLLFTAGSTSLPLNARIRLRPQTSKMLPVPRAHTCSLELEIAPNACGTLGDQFNDGNEEGFLAALQIALANPTGYQMG